MDQISLVSELIEAGERLIKKFNAYAPVRAAFWLREPDSSQWYLYLASDQIDDSNFDLAYSEVNRILRANPEVWLDGLDVKVLNSAAPLAHAVATIQQSYSTNRLRNTTLGGIYAAEVFIYPKPTTNPRPKKSAKPKQPTPG